MLLQERGKNMSIRLALAGNPNCGKTTMFNDLTGATQYVGNCRVLPWKRRKASSRAIRKS